MGFLLVPCQGSVFCCRNNSASPSGQGRDSLPRDFLNLFYDHFGRHRHAARDMGACDHTMVVRNGGFKFLGQPADYVEFRHKDVLGILRGFTELMIRARAAAI